MKNLVELMHRITELADEIEAIESDIKNQKGTDGYKVTLTSTALAMVAKRKTEIKRIESKITTFAKNSTDAQWLATGICPDFIRSDWAE